jgi:hypothetical protein
MSMGNLENTEGLFSGCGTLRFVSDNVESNCLRERATLTDGDNVSIFHRESRRAMCRNVLVSLLETTVLSDVMQIVSSDDDCSLHLGRDDLSLEDSSANRDISREGALLVNIRILDGSVRSLDSKTYILDETHGLLACRTNRPLASYKDSILLLVRLFVLIALDVFLGNANHVDLYPEEQSGTKLATRDNNCSDNKIKGTLLATERH